MSDLGLSGLASGVDTSGIIAKLMQIDQQQVSTVQLRQSKVTAHQSDLQAVSAKLNALKAAAAALEDSATWKQAQTTESSDPSRVAVSLLGGAGIGGHSIQVDRLASSAQHGFTFQSPTTAGAKLTITDALDATKTVTLDVAANATATDVATAINANEASPVYAAVIKDQTDGTERLVLSARKSGQSSDFTIDTSALGDGQLNEDLNYERVGATLNASYKVDGDPTARSSESNVIDNAVPGLRITLKGITTSAATVTTTAATIDKSAISTKVKAFVDAYNAVVDLTRDDIEEKGDPKSQTAGGVAKGVLFGDLGLESMLTQLKDKMTASVAGLGLTSLADIGITVPKTSGGAATEDAKAGKLVFDSTVLDTALEQDWSKVKSLFTGVGTTDGFSDLIGDYVDTQTRTTEGSEGLLAGRIDTDTKILKDYTDQIARMNERMDATQARLKAQFAAMEQAMAQSQTQQAWLSGQLAGLPTWS